MMADMQAVSPSVTCPHFFKGVMRVRGGELGDASRLRVWRLTEADLFAS